MNTYNESLQATRIALLENQELTIASNESDLNAAIVAHYFAQGGKIAAEEKLERTLQDDTIYKKIIAKTVSVNNLVGNLAASTNQENVYVAQTITNAAVAASNTEVASNAIVRLASDLGSIFSIVSAADYGSEIYEQVSEVSALLNDTAYDAEVASQLAMEASILTSQLPASANNAMAKSIQTATSTFMQSIQLQLKALSDTIITESTRVQTAINTIKMAEGHVTNTKTDHLALQKGYDVIRNQMNLNVQVLSIEKTTSDYRFTVSFEPYRNPFNDLDTYKDNPVKEYVIFLVEEKAKTVFSVADAEGILMNNSLNCVRIPSNDTTATLSTTILMSEMKDVANQNMVLGENYVVFVLVTFTEAYKRALNTFDDFMTAPSPVFTIRYQLNSPLASDIVVATNANNQQVLHFKVNEISTFKVAYRCFFIPKSDSVSVDLLVAEQLPFSNYSLAKDDTDSGKDSPLKEGEINFFKKVTITESTTDCFGNRLLASKSYLPMVLSCAAEGTTGTQKEFSNSLSSSQVAPFIFSESTLTTNSK